MNWVKTSDRLPEKSGVFLVMYDERLIPAFYIASNKSFMPYNIEWHSPDDIDDEDHLNCSCSPLSRATHWLPLSEIPLPKDTK